MKRRNFLSLLASSGVFTVFGGRNAFGQQGLPGSSAEELGKLSSEIPEYFFDSGDLTENDLDQIQEFVSYQDQLAAGESAIMPRGGRPKRAPTYRFLRWDGEIDSPTGRFVGPLSIRPTLPASQAYKLNAQILGFNAASEDWPAKHNKATLTIEFRASLFGEPLTWLYAEQFELYDDGSSTLGLEYVGQRDDIPTPIVTEQPNIDIRLQLMRNVKSQGLLKNILKVCSYVVGMTPLGTLGGAAKAFAEVIPAIRVPQMLREGVAFSQAFFGGMADEAPIWRSAFNSYGIAQGGSRLGMTPGLWVAMDEGRQLDLRGVRLQDVGGRVGLVENGRPLDMNYLVLAVELGLADPSDIPPPIVPQQEYYEASPPQYYENQPPQYDGSWPPQKGVHQRDGVPPAPTKKPDGRN